MSDPRPVDRAAGLRFAVTALALTVALFGLLRVGWLARTVVLPFTAWQGSIATLFAGTPKAPVAVTASCSGVDAIALFLGAVLAFPTAWRRRVTGALVGLAGIVALNIVRIATLMRAAGSPWFDTLHLYVWPALLTIAITGYVFIWMSRDPPPGGPGGEPLHRPDSPRPWWAAAVSPAGRFGLALATLAILFVAAAPWYLASERVNAFAVAVAATAAAMMKFVGVGATVDGNLLRTASGAFVVTQECVSTPLIPVYLAAVLALPMSGTRRLVGLLATVPVVFAFGVARLLVLVVPTALVPQTSDLVHGFNQVAAVIIAVAIAATWSARDDHRRGHATPRPARRALTALAAGTGVAALVAVATRPLFLAVTALGNALHAHPDGFSLPFDDQGALTSLPALQLGFLVALLVALIQPLPRRRLLAVAALDAALLVLALVVLGEVWTHTAHAAHIRYVRGFAVALPAFLAWVAWRRHARVPASMPTTTPHREAAAH